MLFKHHSDVVKLITATNTRYNLKYPILNNPVGTPTLNQC